MAVQISMKHMISTFFCVVVFFLASVAVEEQGGHSETVYGQDFFLKIVCYKQVVSLLTEQHGVKMTSTAGVVRVQPLVSAGA